MSKIIVLVLISIVCISFADPTEYEKYMANKKSIGTTLALQVFFPGAGNAYAEQNMGKIIVYPTLYVGSLATAFLVGNLAAWDSQRTTWFWTGIITATLVNIIGTIDAVTGCEKYNMKLREKYRLVSTENGLQLSIEF